MTRPRGARALQRRHPAEILNATVVELALDCIISIDQQGRIIEFNPAAERTFGYRKADVLGKMMADMIIPPNLRQRHHAGMRRYLETGEAHVLGRRLELEAMRADGSVFPVELAIVRVPLPGEAVFTSYVRDLTTQREQQSVLEARTRELETIAQQLRERTEEALRARDEAFRANKAKSAFLAAMSHELRTPLNAVLGYTELLALGVHGTLTVEQRDRLERIKRSASHLLTLINDVLSFARLEAGRIKYDLRPLSIDNVVASALEVLGPQLQARALSFDVSSTCPGIRALADSDKFLQILINLLSNAVRHSPPAGRIVITCERRGASVALTVADKGNGVPRDRLEDIFKPFMQVEDPYVGDRQGTGLGLAISRELARAMKGDVTVESEEGKGASFTLTLPVAE